MKKTLVVAVFLLLIVATAVWTVIAAIDSYRFDMDPANGVDILEGLGAVLVVIVGGLIVLYELDLFYTVYYFFFGVKTVAKNVLNLVANLCFAMCFGCSYVSDCQDLPYYLFLVYFGLRVTYLVVWMNSYSKKETQRRCDRQDGNGED